MLVNFAQNQTVITDSNDVATLTTDPLPVGDPSLNRLALTVNVHHAIAVGSPPSWELVVTAEGSNDGVTWFGTDIAVTLSSEAAAPDADAFDYAFVRITAVFTCTGSGSDFAAAIYDVHGNFVSS